MRPLTCSFSASRTGDSDKRGGDAFFKTTGTGADDDDEGTVRICCGCSFSAICSVLIKLLFAFLSSSSSLLLLLMLMFSSLSSLLMLLFLIALLLVTGGDSGGGGGDDDVDSGCC